MGLLVLLWYVIHSSVLDFTWDSRGNFVWFYCKHAVETTATAVLPACLDEVMLDLASLYCVPFEEPTSLLGVAFRPSVALRPKTGQYKLDAMLNHILGPHPL